MSVTAVRIGTRGSALALAQARLARDAMAGRAPAGTSFEIVTVSTAGDRAQGVPFQEAGPKGLFAGDLQTALLEGRVDVAVHSAKDLVAAEPDGLVLAAFLPRADVRDVVVSADGLPLARLEPGTRVGTSSMRRAALLRELHPHLEVAALRGNVDTRLRKVEARDPPAAVLAGAGLVRLGLEARIAEWLDPARFVPAPAQGAVVIEIRADRLGTDLGFVADTDDRGTSTAVGAERSFMAAIEGSCDLPLGAWAERERGGLLLHAFVGAADGSRSIRRSAAGDDPARLGRELAEEVLLAGGRDLLA